jgi:hypothetical protein
MSLRCVAGVVEAVQHAKHLQNDALKQARHYRDEAEQWQKRYDRQLEFLHCRQGRPSWLPCLHFFVIAGSGSSSHQLACLPDDNACSSTAAL